MPGNLLAAHIDDFFTKLANAKSRKTPSVGLVVYAAHHDADPDELSATPVQAFPPGIGWQTPSMRKRAAAEFSDHAANAEIRAPPQARDTPVRALIVCIYEYSEILV